MQNSVALTLKTQLGNGEMGDKKNPVKKNWHLCDVKGHTSKVWFWNTFYVNAGVCCYFGVENFHLGDIPSFANSVQKKTNTDVCQKNTFLSFQPIFPDCLICCIAQKPTSEWISLLGKNPTAASFSGGGGSGGTNGNKAISFEVPFFRGSVIVIMSKQWLLTVSRTPRVRCSAARTQVQNELLMLSLDEHMLNKTIHHFGHFLNLNRCNFIIIRRFMIQ